jgi:hypothetical protein
MLSILLGMISFATVGGLLLIAGAYFTYKGEILTSVSIYIFADIIWILLGIQSGDFVGAGLIFIGGVLGILAWLKMNSGVFNKTLHKDQKV